MKKETLIKIIIALLIAFIVIIVIAASLSSLTKGTDHGGLIKYISAKPSLL